MRTGLVFDHAFLRHQTAPEMPEQPSRLLAIERTFETQELPNRCARIEPEPAVESLILLNHSAELLDRVRTACERNEATIDSGDTTISKKSFDVALLAAGSAAKAARAVASGRLTNSFCVFRPPGHHAEKDVAMGFCLFNNIAIAARALLEDGLERILIFDFDVHHGNGTQHSFENDPRVLFCSVHGHPQTLYPGTGFADERGVGRGIGTTINAPMLPGCGSVQYQAAFNDLFLPQIRKFAPELVLVSAGFDAHRADPLGNQALEAADFGWMTRRLMDVAEESADGRLVSLLEGGYNLPALGDCAAEHLRTLLGISAREASRSIL